MANYTKTFDVIDVDRTGEQDEKQLMAAIAIGPVAVAVATTNKLFYLYVGGVISDPECGTNVDHAVVAVGYGTDAYTG